MQLMQYAKGISLQTATESETFDLPGYAIDDTSQYTGKEGLPYIDTAAAWDADTGSLNVFVINRNADSSYPVELDVNAFAGYEFKQQLEVFCEDLEAKNSFEKPDSIVPKCITDHQLTDGKLTADVKPLSWNVFCFAKQ